MFWTANWKHVIKYDLYIKFLRIFAYSVHICAKFCFKNFSDFAKYFEYHTIILWGGRFFVDTTQIVTSLKSRHSHCSDLLIDWLISVNTYHKVDSMKCVWLVMSWCYTGESSCKAIKRLKLIAVITLSIHMMTSQGRICVRLCVAEHLQANNFWMLSEKIGTERIWYPCTQC